MIDEIKEKEALAYNEDQIQILEGLEPVRRRPGMYIGSTSESGLHHLVYEIVDNAIDEALAGFCDEIQVEILEDGACLVRDNGRGIPVGMKEDAGMSALEVVFTKLHAGGKFGGGGYKVSGGLHGVGASVVNALSESLTAEVRHQGKIYGQKYARGITLTPVEVLGDCGEHEHGTTVIFKPDPEIFESTVFDFKRLQERMQEMAFLTAGIKISLTDRRAGKEKTAEYCYEGGIREFVSYLNHANQVLYPEVIYCAGERNAIQVEVAMQHNDSFKESTYTFVNNINTPEGGMHLTGFNMALARVVNKYARDQKLLKDSDENVSVEDIKEGLATIISIKIEEPQFEGQTKQKLGNSEARAAVDSVMSEQLTIFFEQNPKTARTICEKSIDSQRVRIASRKARDLARRKSPFDSLFLSDKLSDCTSKDPAECEIFIVEGDSAGGSAKSARDRKTQAILPLRGKILNVEKAREDRIYDNAEIRTMITAFGTGIHEDFDISKLRYDKIILMSDADVDGAHIATLLLTFIYRYMPGLIREGHVYLANPPLYKLEKNRHVYYAYSEEEMQAILKEVGNDSANKIQRYKGLGEMDASQLWETTMDPERRVLRRVGYDPEREVGVDETFKTLMGDDVEARRKFIDERARYATIDA